jgi:hypothetical protein
MFAPQTVLQDEDGTIVTQEYVNGLIDEYGDIISILLDLEYGVVILTYTEYVELPGKFTRVLRLWKQIRKEYDGDSQWRKNFNI